MKRNNKLMYELFILGTERKERKKIEIEKRIIRKNWLIKLRMGRNNLK